MWIVNTHCLLLRPTEHVVNKYNINQRKNIICYYLFNINDKSFSKICCLISEIWTFKNYQLESQVATTGNRLPFCTIAAVDWLINDTTASDNIPLISVLRCNIYLTFRILIKFCCPWWKASYQQNYIDCLIVGAADSGINSTNLCSPGHNW